MDNVAINNALSRGEIDHPEMWPHITEYEAQPVRFSFEFGLGELPLAPGLITIRGARQFGKSTWLELALRHSVIQGGRGSTFFLNGDDIASTEDLFAEMTRLHGAFAPDAKIKRLFIDEITAIPAWEKAIKRIFDRGLLRDVLVVTTGSKAIDLRRGAERLPGRKGKLVQSEFVFLPVSYKNFYSRMQHHFKDKTMPAYLLTGGSPVACNELYTTGRLPEYFIQLTRDWVFGEMVASGRSRISLSNLLTCVFKYGGQAVGYAKLAREAGLANNTVAAGYMEQLADLLCVLPSWPWDPNSDMLQTRKPCKFHFINLAAAVSLHPLAMRSIGEFESADPEVQAVFMEWLVAQEIWRRSVIDKSENPEAVGFWQSKNHEIDFVTPEKNLIEVKRGRAGPLDFGWFDPTFPGRELLVVCATPFRGRTIRGVTMENFLLGETV